MFHYAELKVCCRKSLANILPAVGWVASMCEYIYPTEEGTSLNEFSICNKLQWRRRSESQFSLHCTWDLSATTGVAIGAAYFFKKNTYHKLLRVEFTSVLSTLMKHIHHEISIEGLQLRCALPNVPLFPRSEGRSRLWLKFERCTEKFSLVAHPAKCDNRLSSILNFPRGLNLTWDCEYFRRVEDFRPAGTASNFCFFSQILLCYSFVVFMFVYRFACELLCVYCVRLCAGFLVSFTI